MVGRLDGKSVALLMPGVKANEPSCCVFEANVNQALTDLNEQLRVQQIAIGSDFMRISAFSAAVLTLGALSLGACASSRSLSASFSDLEANAALTDMLADADTKRFQDVDVTIFEGRVLLTGTLPDLRAQQELVTAAWKVEGVRQVIDETFVGDGTKFTQGFTDTRIDTTVRTRLVAKSDVRASDVKIAVSNGVVYLLGVARDRNSLEAMVDTARKSQGVNKVVSHVIYMDAPEQRL